MDDKILVIILGMAFVTYLPRMLPLVVLSRMDIPELVLRWLSYVPAAVLAALLAPAIFMPDKELSISLSNPYFLAAIPSFWVAVRTKSLGLTVLVGMTAMIILQQVL